MSHFSDYGRLNDLLEFPPALCVPEHDTAEGWSIECAVAGEHAVTKGGCDLLEHGLARGLEFVNDGVCVDNDRAELIEKTRDRALA